MLLLELFQTTKHLTEGVESFSPIGAPSEHDQDINWLDDLKFYIDSDHDILNTHFFPAIRKHKDHIGHPHIHKIYIRPVLRSIDQYCDKYEVDNKHETFPKQDVISLAKRIADEQHECITRGDYGKVKQEDCAGVGIVNKQNSTKDVGPGTLDANLKAFKLK